MEKHIKVNLRFIKYMKNFHLKNQRIFDIIKTAHLKNCIGNGHIVWNKISPAFHLLTVPLIFPLLCSNYTSRYMYCVLNIPLDVCAVFCVQCTNNNSGTVELTILLGLSMHCVVCTNNTYGYVICTSYSFRSVYCVLTILLYLCAVF